MPKRNADVFDPLALARDSGIRIATDAGMPVKAPPPPPEPAFWNWAGLYIGAHVGGALSIAKFSDPFGTPIYGDTVRSPGFLGGGEIGYNWQAPGSRWVLGVEADGSLMDFDGTNTCFAVSAGTSGCRLPSSPARHSYVDWSSWLRIRPDGPDADLWQGRIGLGRRSGGYGAECHKLSDLSSLHCFFSFPRNQ